MQQDHAHLDAYMRDGFRRIEGWCSGYLSGVLKLIDAHQRAHGVAGGVAEIGIHHGLLFLMLNSLCDVSEQSYAIDLFEAQGLNIDHSGQGSKTAFLDNMARFDGKRGPSACVGAADSTTADIRRVVTAPVRIFSIDGGHTAEHTVADLHSAQSVLHPSGVVILDDVTNDHWLGVIEGAMSFLQHRPTLVPFAIGFNKLLLANLSHAGDYAELIADSSFASKKDVKFMGWQLVAMTAPAGIVRPAGAPAAEELKAQLLLKERELALANQTLNQRLADMQALAAKADSLEQHVARMHKTVSWRVTAPLRSIRRRMPQ